MNQTLSQQVANQDCLGDKQYEIDNFKHLCYMMFQNTVDPFVIIYDIRIRMKLWRVPLWMYWHPFFIPFFENMAKLWPNLGYKRKKILLFHSF